MARSKPGRQQANQLRIIGGTWRGRKLSFPDLPGLRPTSDRIRETLFNWLQLDVVGANCLDLFAGSGALGLEALSRGAAHVVFVDSQPKAMAQIKQNAALLKAANAEFVLTEANAYLKDFSGNKSFDLVFLDPPFNKDLLKSCLLDLQVNPLLNTKAKIYVESETVLDKAFIPENWGILKEKTAGNVWYYLISSDS